MKIFTGLQEMQTRSLAYKRKGKSIAVVPTMGFLHEGHLSLIDVAASSADVVVVTIFVNPTQFGPGEDFSCYPRDMARDLELCSRRGVDIVFAPESSEMYPSDASTWVIEEKLSRGLCARTRPTHFRGVTTVVAKLFNAVLPDIAVFGQKDAQQALVLRRMVRDLNFPIRVIIAPTVREHDGLAMSSRNKYLSAEERDRATSIFRALDSARGRLESGCAVEPEELKCEIGLTIGNAGGNVDYVEILDADNLEAPGNATRRLLLAVAARFGNTRLIDNVLVDIIEGCAK